MSSSRGRYRYGMVLRNHAREQGALLEYSEPKRVNGGLAPPPCRGLPGTECFMVIVSVNDVDFFGFGPSAALATYYAEKDAYLSIAARESVDEQIADGPTLELMNGDEDYDGIHLDYDLNTGISIVSDSPIISNKDESSNHVNDYNCKADLVSTGMSLCALPTESAEEQPVVKDNYIVPQTPTEVITILETPSPARRRQPDAVSWKRPKRNIIESLYIVARKKGIYDVSFNYKRIGPKYSELVSPTFLCLIILTYFVFTLSLGR